MLSEYRGLAPLKSASPDGARLTVAPIVEHDEPKSVKDCRKSRREGLSPFAKVRTGPRCEALRPQPQPAAGAQFAFEDFHGRPDTVDLALSQDLTVSRLDHLNR